MFERHALRERDDDAIHLVRIGSRFYRAVCDLKPVLQEIIAVFERFADAVQINGFVYNVRDRGRPNEVIRYIKVLHARTIVRDERKCIKRRWRQPNHKIDLCSERTIFYKSIGRQSHATSLGRRLASVDRNVPTMLERPPMRLRIDLIEGSWGRMARLAVRGSPAPMTALMDPVVEFRPSSAVRRRVICRRFEVVEPKFSVIDEEWRLEPIASPPVWSISSSVSAISDADELAYMAFAEDSRAERGGQALAALPNGEYWLMRRSLPSLPNSTLQLANDVVPLPPYADVVLDRQDFYAAAFGVTSPPSYEQPLVGIPVLTYPGDGWQDALMFFEFGEQASPSPDQARTGDAVFVVPTDLAFVLSHNDWQDPEPGDVDLLARRFLAERPNDVKKELAIWTKRWSERKKSRDYIIRGPA